MKQRLTVIGIAVLAVLIGSQAAFSAPIRLSSITSTLDEPTAVALDSQGNLYVAENAKNAVRIFDIKGNYKKSLTVEGPRGLAVDATGNIYVSSCPQDANPKDDSNAKHKAKRVRVYNPDLSFSRILGDPQGDVCADALAIDKSGRIYIVDNYSVKYDPTVGHGVKHSTVNVYDAAGSLALNFGAFDRSANGQFNTPIGIAINESLGEIYLLDTPIIKLSNGSSSHSGRVQVFNMSGVYQRNVPIPFPIDGAAAIDTKPVAVSIDKIGNLYISDSLQRAVRIFNTQTGTSLGALYDTQFPLVRPQGLAVGADNIARVASGNTVELYALDGYETMDLGLASVLTYTARQLGANPASQAITIANTGTGTLNWTATKDQSLSWLTINGQPASTATATGSTGPKGSGNIAIGADITNLTSGAYSGNIAVISDFGQITNITANLTVQPAPILSLSTGGLLSSVKLGQSAAPQPVTVSIQNADTLSWLARSNAAWLSFAPSSGLSTTTANVQVVSAGMAAGTYSGIITFSAPFAIGDQSSLMVTLTITSSTMVSVNTNRPEAGFTITGPGQTKFTGTGKFWSKEDVAPGNYTVTFDAVPGYKKPRSQTKTLDADGTLSFTATYLSWKDLAAKKNIITAKGPWVKNNALLKTFKADGTRVVSSDLSAMDGFYGANIASGDIDGDGTAEIIVGAGAGSDNATKVRIFKADKTFLLEFNPFESEGLRGGVNVAVADFAGDGRAAVIVAPAGGAENPALVKVFTYDGKAMVWTGISIQVHDTLAGVNITAADTDGNYALRLITAPSAGTEANPGSVKIWAVDASQPKWAASFLSEIPLSGRYGATLAAGDIDGDGKDEIIVGTGADTVKTAEGTDRSQVRVYRADGSEIKRITVFDERFGVNVAAADLDGDGIVEIIAGIGPDPGMQISISNSDEREERKNKKGKTTKQKLVNNTVQTDQSSGVVRVYGADGTRRFSITPFDDVKYGVKVATGDLGL